MRTDAAQQLSPGDRRLLHDLAVTDLMMEGERLPAAERVERELGPSLARTLRASLSTTEARAA